MRQEPEPTGPNQPKPPRLESTDSPSQKTNTLDAKPTADHEPLGAEIAEIREQQRVQAIQLTQLIRMNADLKERADSTATALECETKRREDAELALKREREAVRGTQRPTHMAPESIAITPSPQSKPDYRDGEVDQVNPLQSLLGDVLQVYLRDICFHMQSFDV